jgi:hypothetical protein
MPAVSISLRVLAGAIISVLTISGCQTLDDAGRVISRSDLVNDLAARLDRSNELTYSADYEIAGGATASISQSQDPLRAAYTYPGGMLTVTAEATTACDTTRKKPTCTVTTAPATNTKPAITIFTDMNKRGLITPPVVIGLLTAAALDPNAVVEDDDTTVAGRHATCVRVRELSDAPASAFEACITSEGALGSFTGAVDGVDVDLALSRYRDAVESTAFDLPAGAGVVDRRPTQK